jgi:hypothetical protein
VCCVVCVLCIVDKCKGVRKKVDIVYPGGKCVGKMRDRESARVKEKKELYFIHHIIFFS